MENEEFEAYKQFADQMYICISASNKGHDVDFEEVVREEYKKLEVKLYGDD